MPAPGSMQFFLNWAKERTDEMDATLASLENRAGEAQARAQSEARQFVANLRSKRDAFRDAVEKQALAGEAEWERAKAQLEADWTAFENQASKYFEKFGEQMWQQQPAFQSLANAQIKAWRDAADKLQGAASQFAAERRSAIEASVSRMKADAATAEERLQKMAQTGAQPWATLNAALAETRAAFDRANQTAWNAFK